jgi:ABC-2 type transport system permease protein
MSIHASLMPAKTPRSAFGKLLGCEAKYAWRVPIGLIFGVAVPVLVLVILGTIPGVNKPVRSFGGLTYFGIYFPILIALALAVISLISLPLHLANYREQGILRRMSTTPVPPAWMLAAQVIINLALAVVVLGILVVAGTAGFGLGAPNAPGGFMLALALTITAMFAIGLWVSAIARSTGSASIIGQLMFYPLLFFAGLWLPREHMAPILRDISDWTPLGAAVRSLQNSMQGTFPSAQPLLVLVAWALVFSVLAVRFFRWE